MKKSFKIFFTCLVAAFTLASCDTDWTDVRSLDIEDPTIENTNPELYAQYLAALRQYKETAHKQTYAWFDNSQKHTYTRANHVSDVPDSVDVISLMYPADITDLELAEINKTREDKGTKFIYDFDFDAIVADYNAYVESVLNEDAQAEPTKFTVFLAEAADKMFSYFHKYGFDGICFRFIGKNTLHLNKEELASYAEQAGMFTGLMADWQSRNADKLFVYAGAPEYAVDKELLNKAAIVFISNGLKATNADLLSYYYTLACGENVPTEKLGMMISCTSLDETDLVSGWFSDGSMAITHIGDWAATHPVAGIGIYNVSTDYYNKTYSNTRAAIQAISPAVK